jgi:hypothetical protein
MKLDWNTSEYRVEGVLTTKSNLHHGGEVVSTEPVAVIVGLRLGPNQSGTIYKVEKAGLLP